MTTAREQLAAELARLRERSRELAPSVEDDRVGDRGDEAQALERADERSWIEDRIKQVLAELDRLDRQSSGQNGVLPDGTRVTLRFSDGIIANMRVVAYPEEDEAPGTTYATMTADSPLGRALVGCQAGDNISYETPSGTAYAQVQDIQLPN